MLNRYIIVLGFIGLLVTVVGILINGVDVKKIEPYFKITVIVEIIVAALIIIP